MKGATKILPSTKQFDVSPLEYNQDKPNEIMLSAISDLPTHTIVTAQVKIASCSTPVSHGTKNKQDAQICDKSGVSVVQLWEENIGILDEGKSYTLKAFRVAEYDGVKYLAMSRESEVVPSDDITDAVEPQPTEAMTDSTFVTIKKPKIAAVYKLQSFKMCVRCRSPVEPGIPPLGRCSKADCGILQDYTLCETTNVAELLIVDSSTKLCLFAFNDYIAKIAATENPTEEQLLTAPPILEITYNQQNKEIISIVRS